MDQVQLLQFGSVVLLNGSFSLIIGALFARFWLRTNQLEHGGRIITTLRRTEVVAAGLAVVAACGSLWASAAVMSGESFSEAGDMLWMMLSTTTYGQMGLSGLACLFVVLVFRAFKCPALGYDVATVVLLAGFAISRAIVSHAGENGMLSMGFGIEVIHLIMIAIWVGGVAIGGWVVLPITRLVRQPGGSIDGYLNMLSHAATIALIGIVASGLYNAWYRVGTVGNLVGNPYGTALIVKLLFVALAVALGGFNKFVGFPGFMRGRNEALVGTILRIESMLLLGALVAAAVLTSQQPPMAT